MEKIILIGGGGHCKSVIDVIREEGEFEIAGIIDSNLPKGSSILGYKILGDDSIIKDLVKDYINFHITVGQLQSSSIRRNLSNLLLENGATIPNIISPFAHISSFSKLGIGITVLHRVTIQADCEIGDFCILNDHALIEHDVKIGKYCHIATSATINGNVIIEDDVFIGSGAVVVQGSKIKSETFVKANHLFK